MNPIHFLGLNFIPLNISHKETITSFFNKNPQKLSIYHFANLMGWNSIYNYAWTTIKNTLLLSTYIKTRNERHLLQPIGDFSSEVQETILNAISLNHYPTKIFAVPDEFLKKNALFCEHFHEGNNPDSADYLYKSSDLAALSGGPYEKKRNLIAQAEKSYEWKLYPLTEECHLHCSRILADIEFKNDLKLKQELENELEAIKIILSYFNELDLKGLAINIDNHPAAFSIFGKLNPSTAIVLFEKAERQYKGLYQLINRETAKAISEEGFEFINREEDMGIAGLRHAKMSYHPVELISSHLLTSKYHSS